MSDIEYLYARAYGGRDSSLIRFRITKRTAKRVYYLRKEEIVDARGELIETFGGIILISGKDDVVSFVDRQKLEADGKVCNRGVHPANADRHLYASLQGLLND